MRHALRSWTLACLAAGLVGLAAPAPAAYAERAFGGYATEAAATPLKIEVYEPTIPIPATPQAELDLAYTRVEAASGPTGTGLASWLWPGDPVGQGCKTFVEQLKLGDTGLCADGYPVQVNSRTPGEPSSESDEPFPGSLMRTSAGPRRISATVGWSPDGGVSDSRGGGEDPADPGAPAPPGSPEDPLQSLGAAITGQRQATTAGDEPSGGPLPPELAALVDVDGMVSIARTEAAGKSVGATSVSRLTDVSLLGGIITADSITVTTSATADGKQPTASGVSRVTGLEVAGTPVTVGRDGVRLADRRSTLPGLPDDPEKALAQLGVSLVLPRPERSTGDGTGEAAYEGLRIVIDTAPLRRQLDDIPFGEIVGAVPDDAEELRKVLGAATQLAPRFVITAGNATAEATTVPQIAFDLPTVDPGQLDGAAAPPTSSGTGGSAVGGAPGVGPAAVPGAAGAGAPGGDVGTLSAQPTSVGLPPLASIPGALLFGGLVLAGGLGWWLQKIGGLVLGGAGACSHGLETGVPDLRRA